MRFDKYNLYNKLITNFYKLANKIESFNNNTIFINLIKFEKKIKDL